MLKSYSEILTTIDNIDPLTYAKTRNQLAGAVTKLSPYISRGVITLPQVRDRLLVRHTARDCEKLIQELAWREYFQTVWAARGDDIFSDIRFERDDWRHSGIVSAIKEANTGVAVFDAGVRELYDTGYAHNHLRMWLASVSCNLAYAHWHSMGKWLYYHLIDGDLASNFLSWQWVAGTSINKRYTVNQKLINGCSEQSQVRTMLTYDRDDMTTLPTPAVLLPWTPENLQTNYPVVEPLPSAVGDTVCLYTPWTLDPTWRAEQSAARRVLVIDPTWFDRYPVSDAVLAFIVAQGQLVIPQLEVHVGCVTDIDGISDTVATYTRAHQTNTDWPAQFDPAPKLFPAVGGYYKSFFAYWKAVEKTSREN